MNAVLDDRAAGLDDQAAVTDRFLELILADPDLLDAAFAAVEAAWSADPPPRRPTVATRARGPGGRALPPPRRGPSRAHGHEPVGPTWLRRTARSPPGRPARGAGLVDG